MRKTLRISLFTMLLTMFCGMAHAAVVTDELTWEGLGLNGSNNTYAEYSGISFNSPAVYACQASSGTGSYIQLRSNNNNSGIITTTSGGKLKSVTITFNLKTTDRSISIYGKNEPYVAATDLYTESTQGTHLGDIAANDSKTLTVEGDYTYVGLRSKSGAIYIDKITIEWETDGQVQTVTKAPTFTPNGGTFFGSVDVDIDAEAGAKVYYSTNGGDSWTDFTTTLTLTETTTIQAYAVDETKDVKQSATVTAVFTKNTNECNSIAEFIALTDGTEAKLQFRAEDKVQVLFANTSGTNDWVVLQDVNNGRIVLYKTGAAAILKAGDIVNGSLIGKYSVYYGMNELASTTNTNVSTLTVSGNEALILEQLANVAAASDVTKLLGLFRLTNLTCRYDESAKRYYATDNGTDEIEVRDNFKVGYSLPELAEGQTMTITGIIAPYTTSNGTVFQISPISQEAIEVVNATGIDTVGLGVTEETAAYNLAGQRVAAPQKGLFIVNGKKVVLR
ncbi:MAG: chitobiase/beta-hexosaminidase C-terminal domain-containing protein [Prevotella sp.]|nr:chitobiase/beta-hexosaminidase C-terminal domain-containing protein [Prevotella sp.]